MSLPQYTTEDLISNIKRRCSVPTSQLTYTDEDFSLLANDTLQGEVVPLIMSTREEFFVDYIDIPMPDTRIIPLPSNTVGSKVRTVAWLQQGSPLVMINLPRIDLDVVTGVGFTNWNTLAGFYVQGNDLYFYPNTSVPVNTVVRIYFYKRTLALAAPNTFGRVTSVDTDTNTVILDYIPASWTTDTQLNTVSSTPGFDTTNELCTIVTVSSPSLILDSVEGISVGDYISEYGYSAIPQVPLEAHAYLAQLTAAKCLEGLGDREGMKAAEAKGEELKKNLLVMISQRIDGSVKKVMNPSGGLRLNAGLGRWGRGRSGF